MGRPSTASRSRVVVAHVDDDATADTLVDLSRVADRDCVHDRDRDREPIGLGARVLLVLELSAVLGVLSCTSTMIIQASKQALRCDAMPAICNLDRIGLIDECFDSIGLDWIGLD